MSGWDGAQRQEWGGQWLGWGGGGGGCGLEAGAGLGWGVDTPENPGIGRESWSSLPTLSPAAGANPTPTSHLGP